MSRPLRVKIHFVWLHVCVIPGCADTLCDVLPLTAMGLPPGKAGRRCQLYCVTCNSEWFQRPVSRGGMAVHLGGSDVSTGQAGETYSELEPHSSARRMNSTQSCSPHLLSAVGGFNCLMRPILVMMGVHYILMLHLVLQNENDGLLSLNSHWYEFSMFLDVQRCLKNFLCFVFSM